MSLLKEAFLRGLIRRHGIESLGKKKYKGLLKTEGGTDSLTLVPIRWLSKKVLGEKKHHRVGELVNKAIYDLDTMAGKPFDVVANKLPLVKNLFKQEEMIPIGKNKFQRIHRSSITAPFGAARDLVVPAIAMGAISKQVEEYRKKKRKKDEHGNQVSSS